MEMIIIGFDKCGQTALGKHLNCKVDELIYYPDALERYKTHYPGHTPVFILRDRAEKLWSEWHYFQENREMTWTAFLDYRSTLADRGFTTPVERTDYWRYIEPFKEFSPIVVNLEDMQTLMQPLNVNQHIKTQMSAEQRQAIFPRWAQYRKITIEGKLSGNEKTVVKLRVNKYIKQR